MYRSTPARHPSERDVLAVAEAPEEETNKKGEQRKTKKEKDDVVTGVSPSIVENVRSRQGDLGAALQAHMVASRHEEEREK